LILAMLLLATPVMATTKVTVNVKQADQFTASDGNKVQPITITYVTDVNVRAFALDINIDNVNNAPNFQHINSFKTGESNGAMTGGSSGYGIFPSRFRDFIVVTGPNWIDPNYNPAVAWNEPGSTGTGMGYGKFIVEMGTLYAGDPNKPAWSGTLFKVDVNAWGSHGIFHVSLAPDTLRGGVVNQDGNSIPVSDGNLVLEGNDVNFPQPCVTPLNEVGVVRATAENAWTGQGFTLCGTPVVDCNHVGVIISQDTDCYVLPYCINYTYGIQATVPDVVNQLEATALVNITAAGLDIGTRTTARSDTIASGKVISTNPVANTVTCSKVDYVVSIGPCVVPDVRGQAEATATGNITGAGFTVGTRTTGCSGTYGSGTVMATTPANGSTPGCGTAVAYQVSVGTTPGTPSSITVPATSNTGFNAVSWGTASGATSYTLESYEPSSGTTVFPQWVAVYTGTATAFTDKVGGGTWSYRVKGTNICGSGSYKTGGNSCVDANCLVGGTAGTAEKNDWRIWRYPACWCYKKQCRGDVNGKKQVYFVTSADFSALNSVFGKADSSIYTVAGAICADINHKKQVYRVTSADFNILNSYFGKADTLVPDCNQAPLVAGPWNYWTTP